MTGAGADATPGVREIAADLRAEQEALDSVVAGLRAEQWRLATPSPGWSVADQIGHLTYFDGAAALAIEEPEAFRRAADVLLAAPEDLEARTLHRHLDPAELLEAWRAERGRLEKAASLLPDDARVSWYGPSMSARSFLAARLMECWAHGHDVREAVGATQAPTDRLRHIARLGYRTRRWSYTNRGLAPPPGEVRLELTAPSGAVWRFGDKDAEAVISGPALDFCLVVTQRRHRDDTALEVVGDLARDWLDKAQAFAGPPTDGPGPKGKARGR